jgi:GMP synthase-like glutamine amidotransferase
MGDPWIVLQHVAWEGPGLIAFEARERGLFLDVRRLDQGDSIPNPDRVEGLVVMGGPMGAYETDKYPYLAQECRLIRELAHRNRPVLGVCLGAQLLASALGANVYPGQQAEVGFGSVDLTAEGKQDFLFEPVEGPVPVFHRHGDTFDLPARAVLLASSKQYLHQAFRFGSRAYGLQFHVEPDSETWSGWREQLPNQLGGVDDPRQSRVEQVGRGVISRFFDAALSQGILSYRDFTKS